MGLEPTPTPPAIPIVYPPGYPIQPSASSNDFLIYITNGATTLENIWQYITNISISLGNRKDEFFSEPQPGSCIIELNNHEAIINSAALQPGSSVQITWAEAPIVTDFQWCAYVGKIIDVRTTYSLDTSTNTLKPNTLITCGDVISATANAPILENKLVSGAGNSQTLGTFIAKLNSELNAAAIPAGFNSPIYEGSITINQFADSGSALDLMAKASRGADCLVSSAGYVVNIPRWWASPIGLFTDGSYINTSGTYPYNFYYTDIEYGYDSTSVISDITLNNSGLNTKAAAANDSTVFNVENQYKKTQAIPISRSAQIDTAKYTPVLATNILSSFNGTGDVQNYFYWANGAAQNSTTYLSSNGSSVCGSTRISVTSTYTSGSRMTLNNSVGEENTQILGTASVLPGDLRMRFRALSSPGYTWTLRAGMEYYANNGQIIARDLGDPITFSSASTWSDIFVEGYRRAGTRYVKAIIQVDSVNGVGASFYISNATMSIHDYTDYFDGDTPDTSTNLFTWVGAPGNSPSIVYTNTLDSVAGTVLARRGITSYASSVTINITNQFNNFYVMNLLQNIRQYGSYVCQVAVNSVVKTYAAIGYDLDITDYQIYAKIYLTNI